LDKILKEGWLTSSAKRGVSSAAETGSEANAGGKLARTRIAQGQSVRGVGSYVKQKVFQRVPQSLEMRRTARRRGEDVRSSDKTRKRMIVIAWVRKGSTECRESSEWDENGQWRILCSLN